MIVPTQEAGYTYIGEHHLRWPHFLLPRLTVAPRQMQRSYALTLVSTRIYRSPDYCGVRATEVHLKQIKTSCGGLQVVSNAQEDRKKKGGVQL